MSLDMELLLDEMLGRCFLSFDKHYVFYMLQSVSHFFTLVA